MRTSWERGLVGKRRDLSARGTSQFTVMPWWGSGKRVRTHELEDVFRGRKQVQERREEREERERLQKRREHIHHLQLLLDQTLACIQGMTTTSPPYWLLDNMAVGDRQSWKVKRGQNNFRELFDNTADDTFKRRMRMTKQSFRKLLLLVERELMPSRFARGDFMSPRRILSLTLLRLAHGTTFLELGQLFAIGTSTAHKCYRRGIAAICRLHEQFIRMPSTSADIQGCIDSFAGRGFANACLAVDGCHVKVELADQCLGLQDFICYKGFYSLNNIAYVDGKGFFRAVLCGWAGASADGGVVREMDFTKSLQVCNNERSV